MNLPVPTSSIRYTEEFQNSSIPQHIGEVIQEVIELEELVSSPRSFIGANTIQGSLKEIQEEHIIPVFIKDNEPAISCAQFVETAQKALRQVYPSEVILHPNVRLSHPVKGRIPEARNKRASELEEWEKTLYYERCAWVIEIPGIHTSVGGNILNLTIGGVKSYNLDSLTGKSGVDQHFKFFIGFRNLVCTNLCISSDGYAGELKVKNLKQLCAAILQIIQDFDAVATYERFASLLNYSITEQQFAQLIGRCRMYRNMPEEQRRHIPELHFGDGHINAVCRDYYSDTSFCRQEDGRVNLWRLYNLFTNANKQSYIDTFLDREVHALELVEDIKLSLEQGATNWYLS